jgi:hypothetical protein
MCFSPEADFVSGVAISAVGVATLTKVEQPREVALAVVPLALGLHLIVEGFVWLGLEGHTDQSSGELAATVYVLFAWVIAPVLLPLAVWLVEPDRARRRLMAPFVALGAVVGLYLLWSILAHGVTAHVVEHTIQYGGAGELAVPATVLYAIAACVPPLLSSHSAIVVFGVLDAVAVGAIAWAQADGLTSLWCLWAAVVSVLIYVQFAVWRARPARASARGSPSPAARRS